MKKKSIALHLYRYTCAGLPPYAQSIHDGLATSSVYLSPPVTLGDQQMAIDALKRANEAWGSTGNRGGTLAHALLLEARDEVREILKKLAHYCMTVTPNNEAPWLAAGFVTRRTRTKGNTLEPVTELRQFISRKIPNLFIRLKWKKPLATLPRETIVYKVYRSDNAEFEHAEEIAMVMKTTFMEQPPQAGVNYYYWILPVNASGKGNLSKACVAAAMPQG